MSTDKPVFTPFEQWLLDHEELVEHEYKNVQIECEECNGTGIVILEGRTDCRFRGHLIDIYDAQKKRDAQRLAEWNKFILEET